MERIAQLLRELPAGAQVERDVVENKARQIAADARVFFGALLQIVISFKDETAVRIPRGLVGILRDGTVLQGPRPASDGELAVLQNVYESLQRGARFDSAALNALLRFPVDAACACQPPCKMATQAAMTRCISCLLRLCGQLHRSVIGEAALGLALQRFENPQIVAILSSFHAQFEAAKATDLIIACALDARDWAMESLGQAGAATKRGQTALMIAAHNNNSELVGRLLDAEAGVSLDGRTAVAQAIQSRARRDIVGLLSTNQKEFATGFKAVLASAYSGNIQELRKWMSNVELNARRPPKQRQSGIKLSRIAMQQKVSGQQDDMGKTALDYVSLGGSEEAARMLARFLGHAPQLFLGPAMAAARLQNIRIFKTFWRAAIPLAGQAWAGSCGLEWLDAREARVAQTTLRAGMVEDGSALFTQLLKNEERTAACMFSIERGFGPCIDRLATLPADGKDRMAVSSALNANPLAARLIQLKEKAPHIQLRKETVAETTFNHGIVAMSIQATQKAQPHEKPLCHSDGLAVQKFKQAFFRRRYKDAVRLIVCICQME